MLTFDYRDFTRSALSLAGGMLGVALLAGWRSGGDIPTISLTLGLPVGVIAFWGIYSWRMKRLRHELGFIHDLKVETHDSSKLEVPISFQPKLLHRRARSLTLEAVRHLPRFRRRTKTAPIAWEAQDHSKNRDQWHT